MRSTRAASPSGPYQRCGIEYRPCTASTSAATDSSLASLASVAARDSSSGNLRRRSSTLLSASSVLNTYARVRMPGCRPAVTASAATRPHLGSGEPSRERPASRLCVLAVELHRDRGVQLVEQPHPRTRAGDVLLGEDDFLGLGPAGAAGNRRHRTQVVARRTRAASRRGALRPRRRDRGPLELEKHEFACSSQWRAPPPASSTRRARGSEGLSVATAGPRSCWPGHELRERRGPG